MTSDAVIAALKSVQQDHIAEMASCLCGFWLGRRDDFWERWCCLLYTSPSPRD